MDVARFDDLTRSWDRMSRRSQLGWLIGGLSVALALRGWPEAEAKRKKKPKKKKKRPKSPCGDRCVGADFICCEMLVGGVEVNRCCPFELGKCCPHGCCPPDNPYLICGPDVNTPCLLDI